MLTPNYKTRLDSVRVNVIRRAFDSGALNFDHDYDPHTYKTLDVKRSDFDQQPQVDDSEIRQFIIHKAYWVSYKDPDNPGLYPVSFDTPHDLDYLGATQGDIRRNIMRLVNQGMLEKVMDRVGRPTEKLIAEYESPTEAVTQKQSVRNEVSKQSTTHHELSVLISHSSRDATLALALIDLLQAGLALMPHQIRCSSVDGYRLPVGVNTEKQLREEVNAARVVVGLITPSSLNSQYVMFELGARWGANLFLAPLVAGVEASKLSGPLSLLNALFANSEAQLHQLVGDIANHLRLPVQPPASYLRHVSAVRTLAGAVANQSAPQAVVPAPVKQKFQVTVSAEGTPPSQVLRMIANSLIEVTRVEYMLSNETTIAGEDISQRGQGINIPINDNLLLKVWNTPRHDQNHYDHSGPAKIGITFYVDGEVQQFILPIHIQSTIQDNTMYRKVVGSKTFYATA